MISQALNAIYLWAQINGTDQRGTRHLENQYEKSRLCFLLDNPSPLRVSAPEEERQVCITWNILFRCAQSSTLELVIQGVQQVTPSQRRLCQLGPLGKRCIQ